MVVVVLAAVVIALLGVCFEPQAEVAVVALLGVCFEPQEGGLPTTKIDR